MRKDWIFRTNVQRSSSGGSFGRLRRCRVFSGRYKAQLVEGSGNGYLRTACDYVHLNPVRAGLLKEGERLLSYPWSSFGAYLACPEHRPAWIRVDRLLGEHGMECDNAEGQARFEQWMEQRRQEEADPDSVKALRRGWYVGSENFRKQSLLQMTSQLRAHHAGELHRASAEARAQEILAEELKRLGLRQKDLASRRKNDPVKLEIAARLRRETTLTIKDIAARVCLGSSKSANAKLHRYMNEQQRAGKRKKIKK